MFFKLFLVTLTAMQTPSSQSAVPQAEPAKFSELWNYGDPAASEVRFRERLPPLKGPKDLLERLELQTQIARCQGLRGEFEAAHRTLDEVERELKPISPAPVARIRLYLERGRLWNSAGKLRAAREYFDAAFTLCSMFPGSPDYKTHLVDAAHMLAIVGHDSAEKITWGKRGIELAQQPPTALRWLSPLYNNLGEAYRAEHRYEDALACFRAILELDRAAGKSSPFYTRVDEAKMLRLLGRTDESLPGIQAAYDEMVAMNEVDGLVLEEMAEQLHASGKPDQAKPLFRQAWAAMKDETWLKDGEPDRWKRLKEFAESPG